MSEQRSLSTKKSSKSLISLVSDLRSEFSSSQIKTVKDEEQELCDLKSESEETELLQQLKNSLAEQARDDLTDENLLLCLRARKYNVERAAQTAGYFAEWRQEYDVKNLDLDMLKRNFETLKILVPGCKDKQGRSLVFVRLRYHNPEEFSAFDMLQTVTFALLIALKEPEVQIKGIAIVQDLGGIGLGNMDPRITSRLYGGLSGKLPCRLGSIMILKPPIFFRVIFNVISPFMKSKFKKRIQVLGNDMAALQEFIEPEQLLKEYGGTYEYDHHHWIEKHVCQN